MSDAMPNIAPGARVDLGRGIFRVHRTVRIPCNAHLIGDGAVIESTVEFPPVQPLIEIYHASSERCRCGGGLSGLNLRHENFGPMVRYETEISAPQSMRRRLCNYTVAACSFTKERKLPGWPLLEMKATKDTLIQRCNFNGSATAIHFQDARSLTIEHVRIGARCFIALELDVVCQTRLHAIDIYSESVPHMIDIRGYPGMESEFVQIHQVRFHSHCRQSQIRFSNTHQFFVDSMKLGPINTKNKSSQVGVHVDKGCKRGRIAGLDLSEFHARPQDKAVTVHSESAVAVEADLAPSLIEGPVQTL